MQKKINSICKHCQVLFLFRNFLYKSDYVFFIKQLLFTTETDPRGKIIVILLYLLFVIMR